ncbi:MAG: hypothetical protein AAF725_18795 [Acidobacteriota bacterium]
MNIPPNESGPGGSSLSQTTTNSPLESAATFGADWRDGFEAGLPFVLRRGAPSGSLYVDGDGQIGAGTAAPEADLHIVDSLDGASRPEHPKRRGFGRSSST